MTKDLKKIQSQLEQVDSEIIALQKVRGQLRRDLKAAKVARAAKAAKTKGGDRDAA